MARLAAFALLALSASVAYGGVDVAVPELGGSDVLATIGLLAGVVAVAAEIRRRKK